MESIYSRYTRRETSFEMTLSLLQELLESRIRPEFRSITLQGSNSGRARLCFILFNRTGYTIRVDEQKIKIFLRDYKIKTLLNN
jgi:hypothetical protein